MNDKIKGALYGIAVGDVLGAPIEGWRPKDINAKFGMVKDVMGFDNFKAGEFTDDTWLTLATARAYDDTTFAPEKAAASMVIWMRTIGKGIGKLTNAALSHISAGREDIYHSGHRALSNVGGHRGASNGSLMRCISTGLVHSSSSKDLIDETKILSEITHVDPRCVASCVGYNIVVAGLLENRAFPILLLEAENEIRKISIETADIFKDIRDGKPSKFDPNLMNEIGFVHRALERSLIAARDATDFESEMIKVVNEGGDTDTNAAISGGLLGIKFGFSSIPKRWTDAILERSEIDEAVQLLEKYRIK